MSDITRTFARYIVGSRIDDVPERAIHEARRAFVHWIGCALGGCRTDTVEAALRSISEFSGPPTASIVGRTERLDAVRATLVNAMSADVQGYSDTHLKTVLHPGGVVGPALLALAERTRCTGAEYLHSFLIGIEVACRIGVGVYDWHYGRGWHITGTVGTFGAAAGAARLMRLDEQRTTWALGIAATMAAGLREGFGSMCKSLNPGRAAENGLMAALMAAQGYTSTPAGIEGRRGFAHVLGEAPALDAMIEGLGTRFEILDNTYKPFPCGVVIHPTIDGCITLAERAAAENIDLGEIAAIELQVHPLVPELTGRENPTTPSEAKLSTQHSAAAALVRGRIGEQEYAVECIQDALVSRLRARVTLIPDGRIREDEARIRLALNDGRVLAQHVEHVIGSVARPMSDQDIETKVRGLAAPVLAAGRIDALIDACWAIGETDDAASLARLATPG